MLTTQVLYSKGKVILESLDFVVAQFTIEFVGYLSSTNWHLPRVMKPDLPFEMYRNTLRYVPTKQENWSNPRKFVPTNFKDSIVIKNQTIFICAFNFDYLKTIIDIFSTYFTLTFILLLQSLRTCSNIFFILLTFLWL